MEKMIKVLLYTYGKEILNPHGTSEGEKIVVEGLAHLGDIVDITRPYDLDLGERAGAFYTDEERKEIEAGTYTGVDAPSIYRARLQQAQQMQVQPLDGEGDGTDIRQMSADQIADKIVNEKLNASKTLALLPEDPSAEDIEKLMDAETQAASAKGADPRSGVYDKLEADLAAATTG